MAAQDTKRLSRLTAILNQLQNKRLVTASQLADKFDISIRTVYRDMRALEEAGVPVVTEDGKGYSLMEGYRLPPVMFTEGEANALITAEQLVLRNKDASFIKEYKAAIDKIRPLLQLGMRDRINLLSERIAFRQNTANDNTSAYLSSLQMAITHFRLVRVEYSSLEAGIMSSRILEPFALYSTQENWLLVAWCRLRNDHRVFRLDCIRKLEMLDDTFKPHEISLADYFEACRKKYFPDP